MKQHVRFFILLLVGLLVFQGSFFVNPTALAIPYPGNGSIEGSITPVDCGRGFQITIRNSMGDSLWDGYTDDQGYFSTPYSIPEGIASVEAVKIGCNAWPNPQQVNVKADKKSTVRFSCKCPGYKEKNARIVVYMPVNCLDGTSVRITGISNNQSITITQFNTGGFFDSGCELYCGEQYRVEPINSKCSFSPTSQTVKAECCPSEGRVTFRCSCKEDSGRIVVSMPDQCKSGTSVNIYSENGMLVKTLSGSFDTGCTIPCNQNYKIVPSHPQKTFQPSSQMVRVPCCPDIARVNFTACDQPKGRILIYIAQSCIQGTSVDIFNAQGTLVKSLTTSTSQGFDTGCTLQCGNTYKVVPKNTHFDFSPSSQSLEVKECPSVSELHFQCTPKPEKKGRVIVSLPGECNDTKKAKTSVNVYDSTGSLIQILTQNSSGEYDTGCTLSTEMTYTFVPKNDLCTFTPTKQNLTPKTCPDASRITFQCQCQDTYGRVLVRVTEECYPGTSIEIYDNEGNLYKTLTSINSSGLFDSGCTLPCNQKYEIVPRNKNLVFTPSRKVIPLSCCPESSTISFSCEKEKKYGSISVSMAQKGAQNTTIFIYDQHGDVASVLQKPDQDGIFRSGCTLFGGQSYKVVPKNDHCTFDPPSQTITLSYCPDENKMFFDTDCEESEGRIQIRMSEECAKNTRIHIYNKAGDIITTLSQSDQGVFDTGCTLPCNVFYRIVPENDQYTFTPEFNEIQSLHCCPDINVISFQRNHRKGDGRLLISVPKDCVSFESSITSVYIYDSSGNIVNVLNSVNSDGYFDTGENLHCDEFYKIVPKNPLCTFLPEYQLIQMDCDTNPNVVSFQGSCEKEHGKILIKINGEVEGVVVNIFEQDTNHLILTLTESGPNGFDTGCVLNQDSLYHIVPYKENCTFDPPAIDTHPKDCTNNSALLFSITCKKLCYGGIRGYFVNRFTKGAVIHIFQKDTLLNTIQSSSITGYFDSDFCLPEGEYTLKPEKKGCEFYPPSKQIEVKCNTYAAFEWDGKSTSSETPTLVYFVPAVQYVDQNQKTGSLFSQAIHIGNKYNPISDIMAMKLVVRYDSSFFSLDSLGKGELLQKEGQTSFFTYKETTPGVIEIDISFTNQTLRGYGTIVECKLSLNQSPVDLAPNSSIEKPFSIIEIAQVDIRNAQGENLPGVSQGLSYLIREKHIFSICDFNNDGQVNFDDMMIFSFAYDKQISDEGWKEEDKSIPGSPFKNCDIWSDREPETIPSDYKLPDGVIDFNDLVLFSMNYQYFMQTPVQNPLAKTIHLTIGTMRNNTCSVECIVAQPLRVGDLAIVEIRAKDVSQILRGVDISLQYPRKLVSIEKIEEGDYFSSLHSQGTLFVPSIKEDTANIQVAVMGDPQSVQPEGCIAKISIRCLAEGNLTFPTFQCTFRDENNQKIEPSIQPFQAAISQATTNTKIVLQIGSKTAYVNEEEFTLDVAPVILSGRTMVPLRFVSESLQATVNWEAETKTIVIHDHKKVITMTIGDVNVHVNGQLYVLDVPPVILEGRTMVPIRFVSEALGGSVSWDPKTQTVTILAQLD
ncbi:MAG TPA: copper amine oxidase N-terminal domain-containing protein [Caldisericia bacterium]|nr:copper amine oxidase N-terminal domain-containing protein [Caldisericia bacterium]